MRRAVLVLAVLALPACKRTSPAADPPPAAASTDAAAAPPDLSFIRGDVVVVEERAGVTRPVRLDPAKGSWTTLGGGDANLFPTGHRLRGGLLCIATWGTTEADHLEQLAIVRGDAVELFGPKAQMVRNPSVSPDGKLVFTESNHDAFRELYQLAADGTASRLTTNPEGNFEPAVSPDGTTLAFASSRDGNAELYAMAVGDTATRRLTTSARDDWGVTWSPDGKTLAFLSDRDAAQRLYLMPAAGGDAERLTTEAAREVVEEQPRWSPDGKTLAYLRAEGMAISVVLFDVATRKARTITPAAGADLDFAWSPDGAHLAVIRHPDRTPRSPATITFVRFSDGVAIANDDTDAAAVRWVAP